MLSSHIIMAANQLKLNHAKTEVLWCSSSHRQHQIPADLVRISNTDVLPVRSVRDLGVHIDANMTMRVQVTTIVHSFFRSASNQERAACTNVTLY